MTRRRKSPPEPAQASVPVGIFQPLSESDADTLPLPASAEQPAHFTGLSGDERWRRAKRNRAQQTAGESPQAGQGGKLPSTKPLNDDEAHAMVGQVARYSQQIALDPNASGSDRKNAAVAMGVSVDKYIALKKHRHETVDPESRKTSPSALSLADRLTSSPVPPAPAPVNESAELAAHGRTDPEPSPPSAS